MAMNNWGGVTEHMFKKPKNAFKKRKERLGSKANSGSGVKEYKPLQRRKVHISRKNVYYFVVLIVVGFGGVGMLLWQMGFFS